MQDKILLEESGLTAHLKTSITYGDHQTMQSALMGAAKGNVNPVTQEYKADFDATATIEWTFKKLLTMVEKLVDKDGKEIQVTRKVLDELPMADGQALEQATDEILEAIKKK
jgi:hypothetical protein